MWLFRCFISFELRVFTSRYYGAVKGSEALLSLYLRFRMMGITGILRTSVRFLDLHRPMHTTSLLLFWVMGKIKGLQRGYAVSYCKNVKDCIALAYTDTFLPISYTFFIKRSAQPTKHQRQSRLGKRCDGSYLAV